MEHINLNSNLARDLITKTNKIHFLWTSENEINCPTVEAQNLDIRHTTFEKMDCTSDNYQPWDANKLCGIRNRLF